MGNARTAALTALEKCRRMDAWSDAVLGSVIDSAGLKGRDRGLSAALCYGVVQNRMLLDDMIAACSSLGLQKVEPKVLDILRLSAYQILIMDRIPASAAVNEGVKLCRELGFARAAGYVNAVLRRLAATPPAPPQGQTVDALSLRYSHPDWLVELLLLRLGPEETEQLLRCHNGEVPVTLQTNTLQIETEALLESLRADGLNAELHPWLPDCIQLRGGGSVGALPQFQKGLFYVQDAAAKLAVEAAAPQREQRILDVCAAPGGKSFAAAIISGGAEILSADLHENKLKRIRDGAQRLGLNSITTAAMDAKDFHPELEAGFDLVLVDVPCSGLGVIRKKPDIRYKNPAEFASLPAVQAAILRNASRYVAPGGTLLYSTCTVRAEENENVVSDFLAETAEFVPEVFTCPDGSTAAGGMLQLWPHRNGTDGFFIAKLRRSK